jgi:hypothetical protein
MSSDQIVWQSLRKQERRLSPPVLAFNVDRQQLNDQIRDPKLDEAGSQWQRNDDEQTDVDFNKT